MIKYTTDVLLVRYMETRPEVLIILRGGELETNKWALPGGHVDPEDAHDFERAAARELVEETGIDVYQFPYEIYLRYVGIREDKDNYWVGHLYWGIVSHYHDVSEAKAGDDAKDLKWVDEETFKQMFLKGQMAFDHGDIIKDFFEVAKTLV